MISALYLGTCIPLNADIARDTLAELFFRTLGIFQDKWIPFADYYEARAFSRRLSAKFIGKNLLAPSLNKVYPAKIRNVPTISSSKEHLIILRPEKPSGGFCNGMAIDFMRRVKESCAPFFETITQTANKFTHGPTKKSYLYHEMARQVFFSLDYENKLKEKNEKKFANVDIHVVSKFKNKRINALKPGFKTKIFNHSFSAENHSLIPNGDYFLNTTQWNNKDHILCFFKRDEGTAVFDPNLGTFYFDNAMDLYAFIAYAKEIAHGDNKEIDAYLSICI